MSGDKLLQHLKIFSLTSVLLENNLFWQPVLGDVEALKCGLLEYAQYSNKKTSK